MAWAALLLPLKSSLWSPFPAIRVKQKQFVKVSYNCWTGDIPIYHSLWVTNLPPPVNKLKVHLKLTVGNPSLQWKTPCKILDSFCDPSVLCCAAMPGTMARESQLGDHSAFGKTISLFFCYISWVLTRDTGLMPELNGLPRPKMCCFSGNVPGSLWSAKKKKKRKKGRMNMKWSTLTSYLSFTPTDTHRHPYPLQPDTDKQGSSHYIFHDFQTSHNLLMWQMSCCLPSRKPLPSHI